MLFWEKELGNKDAMQTLNLHVNKHWTCMLTKNPDSSKHHGSWEILECTLDISFRLSGFLPFSLTLHLHLFIVLSPPSSPPISFPFLSVYYLSDHFSVLLICYFLCFLTNFPILIPHSYFLFLTISTTKSIIRYVYCTNHFLLSSNFHPMLSQWTLFLKACDMLESIK